MSVIVADANNTSYTTGGLSVANGFYRAEAYNIGWSYSGAAMSLASEVDIAVTFANAGNCQGLVLVLSPLVAGAGMFGVKVALQENVASVWTERASVTLTETQIHALSDTSKLVTTAECYAAVFAGGTFPYAVTTAGGTWRFAITQVGIGNNWGLRQSSVGNPFYVAWCDNKVSFVSGSDQVIAKDTVLIDQSASMPGLAGTGAPTPGYSMILCSKQNPIPSTVASLVWQNPPAAAYTLTFGGLVLVPSHAGVRIGTQAAPIDSSKVATINFTAPTVGGTAPGFGGGPLSGTGKQSFFFYGTPPSVTSAVLLSDAGVGTNTLVTTTSTGWSGGDILAVGGQDLKSTGEIRTFYTINTVVGPTITLTGNLTTNNRKAGGHVLKCNGFSIIIKSTNGTTGISIGFGAPTNFQWQGVLNQDYTWSLSGTYADDAAYVDLGVVCTDCVAFSSLSASSNGGITGLGAVAGQFTITRFHSYGVTSLGTFISSLTSALVRPMTITGCILLSCSPFTFGSNNKAIMSGMAFENCSSCTVNANSYLSISTSRFYGFSSVAGALALGGCFAILTNNTFDNCTLGIANAFSQVFDYGSSFGTQQANTTDFATATSGYASAVAGPHRHYMFSPVNLTTITSGIWTAQGFLAVKDFNGAANDDRIYTTIGNFQRTGSGLSDPTARSAYALRMAPVKIYSLIEELIWPITPDAQLITIGNNQGKPLTVSVWVLINSANFYAGSHTNPTLHVTYDVSTTVTAVATNTAGSWQQLSVTFTPSTTSPYILLWLGAATDATSTNAYVYFDDLRIDFVSLNLGTMDIWSLAMPAWPPISTYPGASQIQTLTASIAPGATTETTLYTVPSNATNCVISSLVVANRGAAATTFRLSCSANGAATVSRDYLYYDVSIDGNDTFVATVGLTPAAGSAIRAYAGNANLSFSIWGSLTANS